MGGIFMQHVKPITFGFKAAGWLDGIQRSKEKVQNLLAENIHLQFNGATGTLFGMDIKGLQVAGNGYNSGNKYAGNLLAYAT